MYNALKHDNFVYFLKELEFGYNTRCMNKFDQLNELKSQLEYFFDTYNYEFYEIDELNDFSKDDYSDMDDEGEDDD